MTTSPPRTAVPRAPTGRAAAPSLRCSECGWETRKWVGRCPECGAWSSMVEFATPRGRSTAGAVGSSTAPAVPALPIGEIDVAAASAKGTGVGEFDRVLGGGLVPGAVVLLAGEPGVGKSTLLLEVASKVAASGGTTLYVTGEESAAQVRLRAERVDAIVPQLYLAAETELEALIAHVEAVRPALLVVDSVQTFSSSASEGAAGGVGQVREVAATLIAVAKARNIATILVGHVTKDGGIAGPRVLEHLVDVVLQFEGDRHGRLRTLRAVKNRYGPSDELGCFELRESGMTGLTDPTGLFVSRHEVPVAGTCVTVALEGRRPLLVEVQALVAAKSGPHARRATSGLDNARAELTLAVLHRRAKVNTSDSDVYLSTVGGAKLTEPAADLAIALATASTVRNLPLPADLVVFGEVGLAGEVRKVPGLQRRLSEAARIGFRFALVPYDPDLQPVPGMQVDVVGDLEAAIAAMHKPRLVHRPG